MVLMFIDVGTGEILLLEPDDWEIWVAHMANLSFMGIDGFLDSPSEEEMGRWGEMNFTLATLILITDSVLLNN